MIFGGPHEIENSKATRQRFANSLQHDEEEVMSVRKGKRPCYEKEDVTFGRRNVEGMNYPHTDALVLTATIGPAIVSKLLVDNESSINILFKSTFDRMIMSEEDLKPCVNPIHGFTGEAVVPLGIIQLPLAVGTAPRTITRNVDFIILDRRSP